MATATQIGPLASRPAFRAKRVAVSRPAVAGFLLGMALLFPWLGAGFSKYVFVHPRVISYAFTAVLAIYRVSYPVAARQRTTRQYATSLAVALLLGLILLLFPRDAPLWLIDDDYILSEYAGYKLTRLILTSIPMVISGALSVAYSFDRRFRDGLIAASLLTAACALLQVFDYRVDIVSNYSYFRVIAGFSTISVSFILNFGTFACLHQLGQRKKLTGNLLYCGVIVACQGAVFLMAQRTSFFLGFAAITLFVFRRARGRVLSILSLALAVFLFAGLVGQILAFGQSSRVDGLYYQMGRLSAIVSGDDRSTRQRFTAIDFCVEGAKHNAVGHGFGAFAGDYQLLHYPHNVVVEAAYELGWAGLACTLFLTFQATSALLRLGKQGTNDFIMLSLLATTIYIMKAGDMSCLGVWIPWIYIGTAYAYHGAGPISKFSRPARMPASRGLHRGPGDLGSAHN